MIAQFKNSLVILIILFIFLTNFEQSLKNIKTRLFAFTHFKTLVPKFLLKQMS